MEEEPAQDLDNQLKPDKSICTRGEVMYNHKMDDLKHKKCPWDKKSAENSRVFRRKLDFHRQPSPLAIRRHDSGVKDEIALQGGKFGEREEHKKGHRTKSYHNTFIKDDYHKNHKIYGDDDGSKDRGQREGSKKHSYGSVDQINRGNSRNSPLKYRAKMKNHSAHGYRYIPT